MRPLIKTLISTATFCTFITLVLLNFSSCRKKEPQGSTHTYGGLPEDYIISYTGNHYVGDTIVLGSNIPDSVSAVWVINSPAGKAVYSYEKNPVLTLSKPGNYFIIIIVENDSANLNDMNPSLLINANYKYNAAHIAKMGGTRWWDVLEDSIKNHNQVVLKQYKDTFAMQVINDTTVVFKNDTLFGFSLDRSNGVVEAYTFNGLSGTLYWKTLKYYFDSDSIAYSSHPPQGGFQSGKMSWTVLGITTHYHSHK